MTNTNNQNYYFVEYAKGDYMGHKRYIICSDDEMYIRGLSVKDKTTWSKPSSTVYEDGEFDASGLSIFDEDEYKIKKLTKAEYDEYLSRMKHADKNHKDYNFITNNCADFGRYLSGGKCNTDNGNLNFNLSTVSDLVKCQIPKLRPVSQSITQALMNDYNGIYTITPGFNGSFSNTKGKENFQKMIAPLRVRDNNIKQSTINKILNKDPEQSLLGVDKLPEQTPIPEGRPGQKEEVKESRKHVPSVDHSELLNLFNQHNNPIEDILYKHPSQMTQKEIDDSRVYSNYQLNDPEKRKEFQKKQSDYYDYYYSTEPLKHDDTGRQIDPAPKHSFLTTPIEARSKDNIPMSQAFEKVAERTAPLGVKPLQKGLNHLYRDQVQKPKLKEDAVLGLKTVSRTKEAMGQFGVGAVKKSLGYGGLASLIEDNRKKEVANDTLKTTMTAVDPKTGGSFLQKGLNEIGKSKPDYQSLKEDNHIGPKTTSAFNKIKEDDEDGLMSWARRLIV